MSIPSTSGDRRSPELSSGFGLGHDLVLLASYAASIVASCIPTGSVVMLQSRGLTSSFKGLDSVLRSTSSNLAIVDLPDRIQVGGVRLQLPGSRAVQRRVLGFGPVLENGRPPERPVAYFPVSFEVTLLWETPVVLVSEHGRSSGHGLGLSKLSLSRWVNWVWIRDWCWICVQVNSLGIMVMVKAGIRWGSVGRYGVGYVPEFALIGDGSGSGLLHLVLDVNI
ncbi:hypothetical protein Ddye_013298 [Dipteronia dyeriana]|uniref:Uncharacterized protein n=1 Tax=Dipteronia dyeriana TaxID=168575 RepID=A0AAE0CJG6_9ROSI|nr:hypothetical protein Ddye_013298 [Dipteronia dyeriana]